ILSNSWSFAPPIASSVRLAIDHAISNGRGGKGCPVFFAAGNANRLVTTGTALAEHDDVILVAASNDRNVRSGYSNFGPEISLNAASDGTSADSPSWRVRMAMAGGTFQEDTSTLLITTTDRTGPDEGLNAPDASPSRPDPAELPSNYTSRFGGTSAACPQAAGVAALMLSVNPDLTHRQVRFLLEATADKIDAANPDPVGRYQPNGHSQSYGFGRVNALEAVKAARASVPQDATERVFVRLRRTSGNRFVSTQILHVVDARRRPASTAGDLFVRTGPDAFLRAKLDSVIGPLIAEAEVNE
ncbi:MAG TPA: S8 family serine peptidase, partial [Thermoanaerobaculia bacterium]|nr:S8 family serine peptidase [Thermoanaerobaculia bacterium]